MQNQNIHQIAVFEKKQIRQIEDEGQIWFSVVDVIAVLTDSSNPSVYWGVLKRRENQLFTICKKFKFPAPDGKMRPKDCATTEGVLRIIQSVPSPKAEPFKLWLAQVGTEKLAEIADPELSLEHLRELYRAKGHTDEWIETRLKSIGIRKELTDEWQKRGVKEGQEYAILTAEIAKATFDLTPTEHAKLKGLEKQNLRDHMTNLELIFTMLGEELTRSEAEKMDAQGFMENHDAALVGGGRAGKARKAIEKTGQSIISSDNFLNLKADNPPNELPSEKETPQ